MNDLVKPFLDEAGRLTAFPTKQRKQLAALLYLAGKFQPERRYTEREVNGLLEEWHTFHDPCTLRRGLYNARLLDRTPDGSAYWLEPARPE